MLNSLGTISKFLGTISEFLRTLLTDFPGLFLILRSGLGEQPREEIISALYKNPAEDFDPGIYASQKTSHFLGEGKNMLNPRERNLL